MKRFFISLQFPVVLALIKAGVLHDQNWALNIAMFYIWAQFALAALAFVAVLKASQLQCITRKKADMKPLPGSTPQWFVCTFVLAGSFLLAAFEHWLPATAWTLSTVLGTATKTIWGQMMKFNEKLEARP